MGGSFLEKYANPGGRSALAERRSLPEDVAMQSAENADENGDDHGCFGVLRGVRDRAVMLELRKKSGNIRAIPYNWIESVEFDPSEGITLRSSVTVIKIRGRNLNGVSRAGDSMNKNSGNAAGAQLFANICRHRVPWVREADRVSLISANADAAVIDSIEWV